MDDYNDKKITLDRVQVEDLRDEFDGILARIANKANEAIESAETEANECREKLSEAKEKIEELENEAAHENDKLEELRAIKKQIIDFERVERLVNFAPGDPGHMYPLHERVERVLKFARDDRDIAQSNRQTLWDEHEALKDAIVPELERLEGHEKRLRTIVDEFAGKVKGERLAALLREAKEAFGERQSA